MATSEKIDLSEVKKSLFNLEERVKNWDFEYDKELDYLYGNEQNISQNTILVHPDKEFGFYITPKGKIEGFVFEYYLSNFVAHNDKFKEFTNLVKKNELNNKKKPEVKHFISDLSDKIISDITELELKQTNA